MCPSELLMVDSIVVYFNYTKRPYHLCYSAVISTIYHSKCVLCIGTLGVLQGDKEMKNTSHTIAGTKAG